MVDLDFQVEGAEPVPHAASPLLAFRLRVSQAPPPGGGPAVEVHSIALRCQVRIEPGRRRYTPDEQARLADLFGEPHRWGQTMRSMLWAHAEAAVPAFTHDVRVDLPVPCTYDFNVAAARYFYALDDGLVPVSLLFSGTVFCVAEDGGLQVAQVPWHKEAAYSLPVRAWQRMMDLYYPNGAWLCVPRDVFDRLSRFKSRLALATWEQAMEALLDAAGEGQAAPRPAEEGVGP
jgi:hypothetical protein